MRMRNEKMMDPTRGEMGLKNANEVVKPRMGNDVTKGTHMKLGSTMKMVK